MVAHAFNPSTQEAEAGRSLVSLRPVSSTRPSYRIIRNVTEKLCVKTKQKRWEIHRESGSYVIMLILNFLIAEEERTAANRPVNERGPVEMNQSRYFKNALTLKVKNVFVKWKSKMLWRRGFAFVSMKNKRL